MPCKHLSICDDCASIFEKNNGKQCYICRGHALLVPQAMASIWN
jgi:rRNA maturation endonuclease Nob1